MPQFPITWRFLIRRGWLLLLGLVLGTGIAWALSGIAVSATGEFLVRATGPNRSQYQDEQLALTYAQLLPEEPPVIDAVSSATHQSKSYVQEHLTIGAQSGTNIVTTRFSATTGSIASTGLRAFTKALPAATDSAGSSLRDTMRPIATPTVGGGISRGKAVLIGAIAGLAIALASALTLEGRHPRVDSLRDLARMLSVPVSQVSNRPAPGAIHLPVTVRRGVGPQWVPADAPGSAPTFSAEERVLVVGRGSLVMEVDEASRSEGISGGSIAAALFVNRSSPVEVRPRKAVDDVRIG